MDNKETFEQLLKEATKENNMEILYMLVMSLITLNNNLTQEELVENLKHIEMLIRAMEDYKDLQNLREKLINYRNNITL